MKVLIFKIGIILAFKLLSLKYAKYIYLYICNISIFVKYLKHIVCSESELSGG